MFFLAMAALLLAATVQNLPSQSEVEAPGPSGPLRGTLVSTGESAPVILMIPGSGPTDRDGNNPLGIRAAHYRLLAEGLAVEGVSSARIDKRGMFGSSGAIMDANAVTINDYVTDTRAWIGVIRERTGVSCVWLMGHSEGGLVALATTARGTTGICGLILVAAPGRPLGDILKAQLKANPANAPLLAPAEAAIDALTAGRRVDATSLPPPLAALFAPRVQDFLISVFPLDPAELISSTGLPVLIIQGERDIQTSMADAERLKAAAPAATLALLPNTNHVLKLVASDDRSANIATYADPSLPLAARVVETMARFIRSNHRIRAAE